MTAWATPSRPARSSCSRSTLETMEDAEERAALQATVDPAVEIPYVRVGDLEVSVEWTIKNLDRRCRARALVQLNGANQFFAYDPSLIVLSADDEAPPTPGLAGDIPLHIPASGTLSGLFREDELREASIDLDQITRGNVNPFRATLTISKNSDVVRPARPADVRRGWRAAAAGRDRRSCSRARRSPRSCGSTSCSSPIATWCSSTRSASATCAASCSTRCCSSAPVERARAVRAQAVRGRAAAMTIAADSDTIASR